MMLVTRLVLLVAALVLLAHGHCAKTPVAVQQEVVSPNTTANERHRVDKDETSGDHRQGRMALHAEAPSSKVKREQALRNILAARRRQLVGPKVSEAPKNWRPASRTARPAIGVSKDPLDMLEAQETRHGVYVTAPIGDQIAIVVDTDDEDIVEFDEDTRTIPSTTTSSLEVTEKSAESVDRSSRNSPIVRVNEAAEKNPKNASQLLSRGQKNADPETRRKNTVAMPESVYNHFRPVESNIPVEDMTQFLYFGQKIQPDPHNGSTTANNSIVDATSASSPIARRRYSTKRFGTTTTPIPMPRLEEMINEEMNIALERGTIERNKIPKTKNVFRSPGSGAYFRKSTTKATDQTIVSNVIPTRESSRNASAESDVAAAAAAAAARPPSDSSANANQIDQVAVPVDRGIGSVARSADNALAHRARNTTEIAEEVTNDNREKNASKTNDRSWTLKPIDAVSESSIGAESSTVQFVFTTDYESADEKSNRITTWQFVHTPEEASTLSSSSTKKITDESALTLRTIGNLAETPDSTTSPADRTTASLAHSSLRIVVTEPMGYEPRFESATRRWESAEAADEDVRDVGSSPEVGRTVRPKAEANGEAAAAAAAASPVNQADSRVDRTGPRIGESPRSSDHHLPSGLPSSPATPTSNIISPPASDSPSDQSTPPASLSSHPSTEHRQQHAYAYEITNVTRLLRNYTGPGLNAVTDRRGKEDGRKKESEDRASAEKEKEREKSKLEEEEEKRKNAGKKKQRKPSDERDERDEEEAKERGTSSSSSSSSSSNSNSSNSPEERGSALTRTGSGVQKIRNDGGSVEPTPQHQPPLPLLPTLQRTNGSVSTSSTSSSSSSSSGGTVEPAARTPGALSAGTDVDGAAARTGGSWNAIASTGSAPIIRSSGGNSGARGSRLGDSSSSSSGSQSPSASSSSSSSSASSSSSSSSSSTSTLVGERGRKGGHGARQQYHQQNQNRGIAAGGRASALSAGSSGSSSGVSSVSGVGGGIGGSSSSSSSVGTRNTQPSASATFASSSSSGSAEVDGSTTARVDDRGTINEPKSRRITDEVTENSLVSSTVRWNHTGVKRLGAEGYGYDRRYLRKSVSAVLNQRPIDEVLVKELKRRRESTLQAGGTVETASSALLGSHNGRRTKGYSRSGGVNEHDGRSSLLRPMDGGTTSGRSGETAAASQSTGGREDAISEEPATRLDGMTEVRERMTEEPTKVTDVNSGRAIDEPGSMTEMVTEVATESIIETTVDTSGASTDIAVDGDERANLTDEVTPRDLGGTSETVVNGASMKDDYTDSPTTPVTFSDELTSTGSTEETTTASAAPAFPVTPRMLRDPDESPKTRDDQTNTDDQGKRVDAPEASRPFGLAKDLEPSEIQKMYRSQTTMRPDPPMTTILPETTTEVNPENPTVTVKGKDHSDATMSPVNSSVTRKPIGSGERSPEVRGRNLSDNIEDKDDVLPIMGLYNTSGIFNGTARDSQEAVTLLPGAIEVTATTTTRQQQQQPSDSEPAATLAPDASESSTTPRRPDETTTEVKRQRGNSDGELGGTGPTRRHRNGGSRDDYSTNHTNSYNSYNPTGANRTRHRPTYHNAQSSPLPPSPPEFIGYRPEFNGSFFEPGMISVSSRESVNVSEVITKRHDGDTVATQETVAVVSYILATLIVFPIAVGVGLILRRLIIRNRKVLEESDTSSEISCRKDALNLENGDFKTSIEKAITKLPRIQHLCHEAEKPPPPPSQESRWEFPRDKLRLQTVLGQGNFGQVWKAEADDLTGHQGTTRLVAVKTVKEGASAREKEDLIRELEIMQQLGNHSNVVTLLGCCTEEEPHYLILEYVMYGKLLAYLRDHRTRQDFYNFSEDSAALTSRDLTVFGYCVARGMEYLASKKIIHRDLAARNVLVDHNKLCKIADFGMSRFANDDGEVIEARHGRNALPIRWMAPESLIYSLFTTKTDVWSFGILMWEIVTLGSTPYPDMAAREVMRNVQNGYRLERPSHCRSELFKVIARCWHADPDRRPEFQVLRRDMAQLLEDSMNGHYVDLESFASECTD